MLYSPPSGDLAPAAPPRSSATPARLSYRLIAAAIVVAALALRLPAPGRPPFGLYRDEAYYGIDAAATASGEVRLYYTANNGREPLFIWLSAPFVAVLGRSPAAPRLVSALVGTLGVAATIACARALLGRPAALFAGALMAVTLWPVTVGRLGLRAGTLAAVMTVAVAATAVAARRTDGPSRSMVSGGIPHGTAGPTASRSHARGALRSDGHRGATPGARGRWLALAGALAGLTMYTYVASRAALFVPAAWVVWREATSRLRAGPSPDALRRRAFLPRTRRSDLVFMAAALLVALPLLTALARLPEDSVGRIEQVSIMDQGPEAVARGAAAAVGAFALRGDRIIRHNQPGRPAFGPLAAAIWALGTAVLLARVVRGGGSRRAGVAAAVLIWWAAMLLPTALAEDAPHFLRGVGALPPAALAAGAGAAALLGAAGRHGPGARAAATGLLVAAVGLELAVTMGRDREASRPDGELGRDLYHAFEGGAVGLAAFVNQAIGRGWVGGWAEVTPRPDAAADRGPMGAAAPHPGDTIPGVWLDRRLRDGWAAVPYLVDTARLTLVDPYDPVFTTGPGVAFLWPYDMRLADVWSRRPAGLEYRVRSGTTERGDLESEPRTLFVRVEAAAAEPLTPAVTFANGVVLYDWRLDENVGRLVVESRWGASRPVGRDVTMFVQVLDGGAVTAGSDAPLGSPYLPVPYWQPGDRVVERRELVPVGAGAESDRRPTGRVIAGLYEWPDLRRVVPTGPAAAGDHVVLGVRP